MSRGLSTAMTGAALERLPKQIVRPPKAAELISHELRKQIVRGEVQKGTTLVSESEMMARFRVSRPTLREAIRILEAEGLITVSRGARGGAIVRKPSIKVATRYLSVLLQANKTTLADIYRVHVLVEPAAARIVAIKHRKTAPAILRKCVSEGQEKFDNDFEFGAAAARFRDKLIELAEIPPLLLFMGMLNNIFETYWGANATLPVGMDSAELLRVKRLCLRSLEKLILLIEAGDGDGAELHWRKHCEAITRSMSKWLASSTIVDIMDIP